MSDKVKCPHCHEPMLLPDQRTDAYWLRLYAGQIRQGVEATLADGECATDMTADYCVDHARKLLAAVKEGER